MFEEKFGMFPKKKVVFDGNKVTVKKEIIPIDDIKVVYFRPYSFSKNEWGSIYFSSDGEDVGENDLFNDRVVKFTNKQTSKINELLEMMNVEVIDQENHTVVRKKKQEEAEIEKNTVRCPNCQSVDVSFLGNKRKGFSVGKAIGGTLLTGGIGSLAGFAGKKGKKDNWHCENCGYTFERKRK